MKQISIQRIFNRITGGHPLYKESVQIPCEEGGFYSVWKAGSDSGRTYLLKKEKMPAEEEFYRQISGSTSAVAEYFGGTEYYGKRYFLTEFFEGETLSRCHRPALARALNALTDLQEPYWQDCPLQDEGLPQQKQLFPKGTTIKDAIESIRNRRPYLQDPLLEKTLDLYIRLYEKTERTLCHDDLLPFNILASEDRAVLIDWEYYGLLPYPVSFARLIAHTRPETDWDFVMSEEDRAFAIDYYFEHLVSRHGISYPDYRRTLDLFLFYEMTEWIYVCRKYHVRNPKRFRYAMDGAMKLAEKINA